MAGRYIWFSEISKAPYGYVMVAPYEAPDKRPIREVESRPPDDRLVEITQFADYDWDEQRTLNLSLPVMSMDSPMPGDYRTKEEMYQVLNT